MKKLIIHVINGPNLNLLGLREPQTYGATTLKDLYTGLVAHLKQQGFLSFYQAKTVSDFETVHLRKDSDFLLDFHFFQSNHEGGLVEYVQGLYNDINNPTREVRVIINPAAYGHTSIALRDAFLGVNAKFVEVHISNIYKRETFRHHTYLQDIAQGSIVGMGTQGYYLALDGIIREFAASLAKPQTDK